MELPERDDFSEVLMRVRVSRQIQNQKRLCFQTKNDKAGWRNEIGQSGNQPNYLKKEALGLFSRRRKQSFTMKEGRKDKGLLSKMILSRWSPQGKGTEAISV